jgi:hypothetical protein
MARLVGVTCLVNGDCWAVGQQLVGGDFGQPLIEKYSRNAWTSVAIAGVDVSRGGQLMGVACLTSVQCWAIGGVGLSHQRGLIMRLDGNVWTTEAPSTLSSPGPLEGIACQALSYCVAVTAQGAVIRDVTDPNTPAVTGFPFFLLVILFAVLAIAAMIALRTRFDGRANLFRRPYLRHGRR